MLTGPVTVTAKVLKKAGMSSKDIDLWELNEAFAAVVLRLMQAYEIPHDIMNVNGGAIALGHPLGATGTKLMTTLIHGLKARNKRWGLQTMCEGGGVANVTIIEMA
jgi:acetyl-CoA C-acetyltransferase